MNCIKIILKYARGNLFLEYDADRVEDGLGAQLQRQLSISSLANFLRIGFIPRPLRQIAIHPLDSFQTVDEMKAKLTVINKLFMFDSVTKREPICTKILSQLNLVNLLVAGIRITIFKRDLVLRVSEAYRLVDSQPNMYLTHDKFNKGLLSQLVRDLSIPSADVCIHIRQGVGGKVIYPGQSISRELDLSYFLSIVEKWNLISGKIIVLTDAPENDLEFKPLIQQVHLWEGTPGFAGGVVKIQGQKIGAFFKANGVEVEVISGGDLLNTLLLMMTCKNLIISRSSLSYVAAILNEHASIFYPTGFWHPALPHWKQT